MNNQKTIEANVNKHRKKTKDKKHTMTSCIILYAKWYSNVHYTKTKNETDNKNETCIKLINYYEKYMKNIERKENRTKRFEMRLTKTELQMLIEAVANTQSYNLTELITRIISLQTEYNNKVKIGYKAWNEFDNSIKG